YRSDQTLVKTMQQMLVVGPGSVPVQFAWDGSQDPPAVGIAPKRVYLFRWTLGGIGQTPPTTDSDKSALLGITPASVGGQAVPVLRYGGVDGDSVLVHVSYHLSARGLPDEAHIRLYGPDLALRRTFPLGAPDVEAGSHATGGDNAPVRLEVPRTDLAMLGEYTFLISIRDSAVASDRGHRNRWALSLGGLWGYEQARVEEPAPVEGGQPQVFRGRGEDGAAACPVVLAGSIEGVQAAEPLLKLTYSLVGWNGQGYETIVGHEEREIPLGEIGGQAPRPVWDAGSGRWRFRVTWVHGLARTLVWEEPGHPEELRDQRWAVHAHALCDAGQQPQWMGFRVLRMARPVQGAMLLGRDWLAQGPPTPWRTTGYNQARTRWLTVTTLANAPHLGIDYAGAYESVINTAEYGQVEEGPFDHEDRWSGVWPPSKVDEACDRMAAWEAQHPGLHLTCTFAPGSWDNDNNLGPHRRVLHGKVNIDLRNPQGTMPDEMYSRGTIQSAYGHLKEPKPASPAAGSWLDISRFLAQVGRLQPGDADPFGLGDFRGEGGELVFLWNGVEQFRVTQIARIVWPSTSDTPHLHFEVRMEEQEVPPYPKGQVDPHHWLGIGYGLRR
ncbi:MAG: hypothetical protein IT208_16520, partial [Chthonomonadales bacterium]|nr:hypothetical protein [Chthonomonadales bacterium]